MSDNDIAIEMGLIDGHGDILVDSEPEESDESSPEMSVNYHKEVIEISLTPSKYLDKEGQYLRSKLINNQLNDSEISLEVMHDRYNENDPLALQVFCNQTSIGYIQKYDNDIDLDDWCFVDNEKIIFLTLEWKKNRLLLSGRLSFIELITQHELKEEAEKKEQRLKEEAEEKEQRLKEEAEEKEAEQERRLKAETEAEEKKLKAAERAKEIRMLSRMVEEARDRSAFDNFMAWHGWEYNAFTRLIRLLLNLSIIVAGLALFYLFLSPMFLQ